MRALETPRLTLNPLRLEDAPEIQATFPRWEIVRWLADEAPWPYPANGARAFLLERALPQMARMTAWHWSLRPKTAERPLIGMISLRDKEDDHRGFWLVPECWGQGLMTEAAEAVTRFWFEDLDRPVLRIAKSAENVASRRISLRQGMRVIERFPKRYAGGEGPAELWEITQEEWRARTPS